MQRLIKMVLISALLILCAPLGPRHAQGELDQKSIYRAETTDASFGGAGDVAARINGGSFTLEDSSLRGRTSSTLLKGRLVNRTNHRLDQMTLEVKAYDREGNLLHGVEEKTIFTARQLEPAASASINYGYGVWLQGIPLQAIARVEIYQTGDKVEAARQLQLIPFASHALFLKEYSEIEE